MLRNLLLKEIEIVCLLKRELNWWRRNTKVESLNICNDWKWRTPSRIRWIWTRTSLTTRSIGYEWKSSSRDSNSEHARDGRNEEGAQELRVDESLHRSWESHETIQRLTSQVQELQERMNYLTDSGDFHEVESNYGGKFVTRSQSTSRDSKATLYAKLRQTLATYHMESIWITGKRFSKSTQILYRGTHPFMTPNAAGETPALISTGKAVARKDERVGSTIPMPTFARRPPIMSSLLKWILHSSVVGQQRQQISELQFDKFPDPQSFLVCWFFHRKQLFCIEEADMVDYSGNRNLRDPFQERYFQIFRCWTRRLLLLWTRSSSIPISI